MNTSVVAAFLILLIGCTAAAPQGATRPAPGPATRVATTIPVGPAYLLHLPGIGGARSPDHALIRGFRAGGYTGEAEIFDWTDHDPGLPSLVGYDRNQRKAQLIADKLTRIRRANPEREIIITAHSGGTGVAVWALEKLPADVKVDRVLLLSSALSPEYDLSPALRHVSERIINIWSPLDSTVLNTGTTLFGTIDGVKEAAAGFFGFTIGNSADMRQYRKLDQIPYDPAWEEWDNDGGHIGPMHEAFADHILAPLILQSPAAVLSDDPKHGDMQ